MKHRCLSLLGGRSHLQPTLLGTTVGLLAAACAMGAPADGPASGSPHPAAARVHGTTPAATPAELLAGMIVGIDPGHNGRNVDDSSYIGRLIWNGRNWETCNTTGTETDSGYTEARFNFNVATFLREDLQRDGARVVMTRSSNDGVGPCVNRRAQIINRSHADVAIDIHADGAPPQGRGFAVLEPVADGPNDAVIAASGRFGRLVRTAVLAGTAMPVSTYDGKDGINHRGDLAGLNLTSVPEVLIECGNMKNPADAALLTSAGFQQRVAAALEAAIIRFLRK
jgi:N-acetylmuramoyl-L-alanine amidase